MKKGSSTVPEGATSDAAGDGAPVDAAYTVQPASAASSETTEPAPSAEAAQRKLRSGAAAKLWCAALARCERSAVRGSGAAAAQLTRRLERSGAACTGSVAKSTCIVRQQSCGARLQWCARLVDKLIDFFRELDELNRTSVSLMQSVAPSRIAWRDGVAALALKAPVVRDVLITLDQWTRWQRVRVLCSAHRQRPSVGRMPQAPSKMQLGLARPNSIPRAHIAVSAESTTGTDGVVQDCTRVLARGKQRVKVANAPSPRNTAAAAASIAATGACTATRDSTAATTRCMRASASCAHSATRGVNTSV